MHRVGYAGGPTVGSKRRIRGRNVSYMLVPIFYSHHKNLKHFLGLLCRKYQREVVDPKLKGLGVLLPLFQLWHLQLDQGVRGEPGGRFTGSPQELNAFSAFNQQESRNFFRHFIRAVIQHLTQPREVTNVAVLPNEEYLKKLGEVQNELERIDELHQQQGDQPDLSLVEFPPDLFTGRYSTLLWLIGELVPVSVFVANEGDEYAQQMGFNFREDNPLCSSDFKTRTIATEWMLSVSNAIVKLDEDFFHLPLNLDVPRFMEARNFCYRTVADNIVAHHLTEYVQRG